MTNFQAHRQLFNTHTQTHEFRIYFPVDCVFCLRPTEGFYFKSHETRCDEYCIYILYILCCEGLGFLCVHFVRSLTFIIFFTKKNYIFTRLLLFFYNLRSFFMCTFIFIFRKFFLRLWSSLSVHTKSSTKTYKI